MNSYGYVMFENKKDATRALQQCSDQPFLIGPRSACEVIKPIKVELAKVEVRVLRSEVRGHGIEQ